MISIRPGRSVVRRAVLFFSLVLLFVTFQMAVADGPVDWAERFSTPGVGQAVGLDGSASLFGGYGCQPQPAGTVRVGSSLQLLQRLRACGKIWYEVQLQDGRHGWMPITAIDDGSPKRALSGCFYSGGNSSHADPYGSPRLVDGDHVWVRWKASTFRPRDLVQYVVDIDGRTHFVSRPWEWKPGLLMVDLNETVRRPETGKWTVWVFVNDLYVDGCWFNVNQ